MRVDDHVDLGKQDARQGEEPGHMPVVLGLSLGGTAIALGSLAMLLA